MKDLILYEDDYCFAINKPNNLIVHHSYYARNIEETSLVQTLKEIGFIEPVPIHRLDRKTSGVILFAKSKEYVKSFQELFDSKTVTKKYIALLRGHINESITIDSPVKNEKGNYKDALSILKPSRNITLSVAVKPYETSRYCFVEFYPQTGRTHQLRIHANKISHPIIGDHKHGNRHHNHMFADEFNLTNLFLHSQELSFSHPFSKNEILISAPKPEFWVEFEAIIKEKSI